MIENFKSIRTITKGDVSFVIDPNADITSDWGFWDHLQDNKWEPHTFEIFNRFLSKDKTYVDVGAWIGPTVLFGSQLAKRCVAFEPDPNAFKAIQSNLKLNPNITNAECHQIAISDSSGFVSMGTNSNQGDSMSSLLFADNNSWQVEAITLQEAFEKFNITDCNFIKMDIEGGESMVLPTIKDFIYSLKPTFYLALHTAWISDKQKFFNTISDVFGGYKNIYDSDGKKISFHELPKMHGFAEILATNEEW